jgi:hypothetical protein
VNLRLLHSNNELINNERNGIKGKKDQIKVNKKITTQHKSGNPLQWQMSTQKWKFFIEKNNILTFKNLNAPLLRQKNYRVS